jgi:hypothetical protein
VSQKISETLCTLANRLRESKRYAFFKHVNLGRLLSRDFAELDHLAELTLSSLIELITLEGTTSLSLQEEQIESLCELLSAMLEDEPSNILPVSASIEESASDFAVNSVQLELDLRDNLKRLAEHKRYQEVKDKPLGEFWKPGWLPAPFEEMLTIKQLGSMDLSVLFKKKMVSDSRVECMVLALEAALDAITDDSQTIETVETVETDSNERLRESLFEDIAVDNLGHRAILEVVRLQHGEPRYRAICLFIDEIAQKLSTEELLILLGEQQVPTKLQKRLKAIITKCLEERTVKTISYLLQGPGIDLEVIGHICVGEDLKYDAVIGFVALLVARGLGAQAVEHAGHISQRYWSVNPSLLEQILSELGPKSRVEDIYIHLDPKLHAWCQSHGGAVKKRTEKRKRLNSRNVKAR